MITLNENNKRVTWRLDTGVHKKLTAISKQSDMTIEEVANIILDDAKIEDIKPALGQYRKFKREAAAKKKAATEAVSQLDSEALSKLSNMDPDKLSELLSKL